MSVITAQNLVKDVFRLLCTRTIDSPLSREIVRMNDKQLSEMSIDPRDYLNARDFGNDYLVISLLSKYKGLATGVDTEAVALGSFAAAEEKCSVTNKRLKLCSPTINDPVLHRASRLIAKVLGVFPSSFECDSGRWGPGSTYEFTRQVASLDTKIAYAPFTVTRSAAPFFIQAVKQDYHWTALLEERYPGKSIDDLIEVVPGSRISTVPKNAKTDRTIAIEPRGNMFLQKSVGSFIRSRLKRVGVDLDNQGLNQTLAADANLKMLATLDLKAASDSICLELIYSLLPFDWASYLDAIRSKAYTLDGKTFTVFQKFSSMGNGFTFELESLLFWALTQAVCEDCKPRDPRIGDERILAIYGDDIICPQEKAWEVTSVLNYCGFDINLTKSFYEGNFFESCGKHYFDGVDVTPIYQKELVNTELEGIRFHNRLARWFHRNRHIDRAISNKLLDYLFKRACTFKSGIPLLPICAEGDDGFAMNAERLAPYLRSLDHCKNRGTRFLVRRTVRVAIPADEHALYTYKLREIHLRSAPGLPVKEFDGNIDSRSAQNLKTVTRPRWIHIQ